MKDTIQLELLKFGYGIDHKIHPQPILDLFKNMGKTTGIKTHKYNTRQKTCPTSCPILAHCIIKAICVNH